jgi:hypothetical protein
MTYKTQQQSLKVYLKILSCCLFLSLANIFYVLLSQLGSYTFKNTQYSAYLIYNVNKQKTTKAIIALKYQSHGPRGYHRCINFKYRKSQQIYQRQKLSSIL